MIRVPVSLLVLVLAVGYGWAGQGGGVAASVEPGGYLGVGIRDVTREQVTEAGLPEERGVYIANVEADSPAEKAGFQEGDLVWDYAGMPVLSVRHFQRLVSDTPAGRQVGITVWRNRQKVTLNAELGRRKGALAWIGEAPGTALHIDPDFEFDFDHAPSIERFQFKLPEEGAHIRAFRRGSRLGIQGIALTDQMAQFLGVDSKKGVLVLEVREGTPAEAAGLKAGDVIVSANGQTVGSIGELQSLLQDRSVQLSIVRERKALEVPVDLSTRSEEAGPRSPRL